MLHIDIVNKSTYSNNSLFTCCGGVRGKQQMEGNNRGRGRRVPCECFCPPDSTAHICTHTHRQTQHTSTEWKQVILLTAGTSFKRKKNTRESNMTGIYERQRQKDMRGTKDVTGRKKKKTRIRV